MPDLVIGLDASTTSTKAIAWDRTGHPAAEASAPVPMANPAPGIFEQDPEDWWTSARTALAALIAKIDPTRLAALAISAQRETVGFLDAAGRSVRPANVWLDERRRLAVPDIVAAFGRNWLRETTGKPPDPTPALYALHWLRTAEPDAFARTAHFVEVHGTLAHRLTAERRTAFAAADPHGMWDITTHTYAPEILGWLGLTPAHFFTPVAPGTVLGTVTAEAAAAAGLPKNLPVVAGGGDGQAAALGCGVIAGGTAYLNLGTATVAGVYASAPVTADAFRTMTAVSGPGYVQELVLRTGAFLTDWLVRLFGLDPRTDPGCYAQLEAEAASTPPGANGLLLLPHWSGIMNPHWDFSARGAILGLGPEHGRGHIYRALIEGIALELAAGFAAMAALGTSVSEIVAIGGGARSAFWRQTVADVTGIPVTASSTVEASSLGAAMLAATAAGWFPTVAKAAAAMRGTAQARHVPEPTAVARYRTLAAIQAGLYPALRDSYAALARFRAGDAP